MAKKTVHFIVFLTFILGCSTAYAQSCDDVAVLPQKQHRVRHGKPLFNYPREHLAYVITYTQDDLLRMKRERLFRALANQYNKTNTGSDDLIQ